MGDIRTHLFRINTSSSASQFSSAGKTANPFITLSWACKPCHQSGGIAPVKSDSELAGAAKGYHDPQQ
jgi:hypothetical protein